MPAIIDGTNTSTLPGVDGTTMLQGSVAMPRMVLATAQNTTSGTAVDFTGIPSWVRRVTVMLNGVSTNGTSVLQVQTGAGSVTTSGYSSISGGMIIGSAGPATYTTGFPISANVSAATVALGSMVLTLMGSNTWVCQGTFYSRGDTASYVSGSIALGGTLDRIRLTTVNGTDTFDAGSVNVMYEG